MQLVFQVVNEKRSAELSAINILDISFSFAVLVIVMYFAVKKMPSANQLHSWGHNFICPHITHHKFLYYYPTMLDKFQQKWK